MAKIPRAAQLGLDPSAAQQTRGVVDIPIPDFSGQKAAAQAVGEVGKTMLEFGNRLQEAETDRKIVTATNATRSELDKTQRDILADPNIKAEDYEKVYQERSDAIFKTHGATIPGGKAKAVWDKYTGDLGFSGLTQMRSATRQKQLESATAETISIVAKTVEGFSDLDQSEEVFTANFTATHEYISNQVKSGLMTPDRGAQALAELEVGFHKAETERTLYSIDGMRQAKNYAGAIEALYAAKKENRIDDKTFSATKAVLLNEQNGFEAQADADKYWEQGKGYQGALALARKEPDIAKRQEIEKNLATRAQQDKLAKQDEQDSISKQLADHVLKGGTLANAPTSLLSRVTDSGTLSLANSMEIAKNREASLSGPQMVQWKLASSNTSNILQSREAMPPEVFMADPSTWSPRNQARYQSLTPDDQVKMDETRRKMRDGKGDYSTLSKIEGQLVDLAKTVAPKSWGLNNSIDKRTPETERLLGELRGEAVRLQQENGGADLTPDQLKLAIARSLKKSGESVDNPFVYWQLYSANMDPTSQMSGVYTMEYQQLYDELKAASGGLEPDLADVEALRKARSAGKQ